MHGLHYREVMKIMEAIMRLTLLITLLLALVAVPAAAQDSFAGSFIFLERGLLYQYQDGTVTDVCRVPLTVETSESFTADTQITRRYDVAYSPDAQLVALATNHATFAGMDFEPEPDVAEFAKNLFLCDLTTGEIRQISPEPSVGFWHELPTFSPDGTQLIWMETNLDRQSRILRYDIATETVDEFYRGVGRTSIVAPVRSTAIIWEEAGIAMRGISENCDTDALVVMVNDEVIETCTVLERIEGGDVVQGLYWAELDDRMVVAYKIIGPTPQVQYFDPATGEHFLAEGEIVLEPIAEAGVDFGHLGPPQLRLHVEQVLGYTQLATTSQGPESLNGYPFEFAFSADGQAIAMLVSEGIARGGTDLFLLDSFDLHGGLGYVLEAELVSSGAHWGESGATGVYWGQHRTILDLDNDPVLLTQ